ncbi:MAG: hypothetical protein ACQEQ0_10690 [Bacteroidota bacterium]
MEQKRGKLELDNNLTESIFTNQNPAENYAGSSQKCVPEFLIFEETDRMTGTPICDEPLCKTKKH